MCHGVVVGWHTHSPTPDHLKPICTASNAGGDISNAPGRWCGANAAWLKRPNQAHLRERDVWFWTVDACRLQWFTVKEARVGGVGGWCGTAGGGACTPHDPCSTSVA